MGPDRPFVPQGAGHGHVYVPVWRPRDGDRPAGRRIRRRLGLHGPQPGPVHGGDAGLRRACLQRSRADHELHGGRGHGLHPGRPRTGPGPAGGGAAGPDDHADGTGGGPGVPGFAQGAEGDGQLRAGRARAATGVRRGHVVHRRRAGYAHGAVRRIGHGRRPAGQAGGRHGTHHRGPR